MEIHLKYYVIDALKEHPQKVMENLGITYQHATPQTIADQWWFWNCENVPPQLPSYMEVLNVDPMDAIGHGLSETDARQIKERS